MPKSKAELIVELREQMKGTPYKMSLSKMKLHELEVASATMANLKKDVTAQSEAIPAGRTGRLPSRPIEPVSAGDEDDDGNTIKIPEAPKPRITKAPLVNNINPERPVGNPNLKKKPTPEVEPSPLKGKSQPSHICNCPHCPTRK
jgi:hypothetical protein